MKKLLLIVSLAILLVAGFGAAGYFYKKNTSLKTQVADLQKKNTELEAKTKTPEAKNAEELKSVIAIIGQSVDLPKDETPSLATVQDKEKLKDQVFFAKAQNGDKLLIYSKIKTAYLWRPSTKKLINVGPVSITDNATAQPGTTGAAPQTPAQP